MNETQIENPTVAEDEAAMLAEFEKLSAENSGLDPHQEQTEPAPSTEGVVTSEAVETTKPAEKADKTEPTDTPRARNLGGLSTSELIALVANPDVSAEEKTRAVEIRLKREENSRAGRERVKSRAEPFREASRKIEENFKGLEADFPEIASRMKPVTELAQTLANQASEQDAIAEREHAQARIADTFPGFLDVVRSKEFPQWLGNQSDDVKRAFQQGGVDGAYDVLARYEDHVVSTHGSSPFVPQSQAAPAPAAPSLEEKAAQIRERRQKLLQQAPVTPSRARGETNVMPALDDFDSSFEYFAKREKRA